MARQPLIAQPITSAGVAASYTAAHVDGHSVKLTKGRLLHVKNGSGASVTATIPTPGAVDGLAIADRTVTIPAGEDRFIGLGEQSVYRQAGQVAWLDFDSITSVTVAALDVP